MKRMENTKTGVVGLGSMGKRRIRLLGRIRPDIEIIGIDSREDRRNEAGDNFGIRVSDDLSKAIDTFSLNRIIVSTSPLSHGSIINTALKKGCHVFTEINLVDDLYDENIGIAKDNDLTLFLSSTMLYRNEIQYMSEAIAKSDHKVNYIYHVGQFLPTWHPWEDIKDFFVSDRRTNGCREVFAIELPWMIETFGEVESFEVKKGRMTDLDIDYPDNYELIVTHKNGNVGTLNVNIASEYAVRNLEIYAQDLYIRWEGTPDSLRVYDPGKKSLEQVLLYGEIENIMHNSSIIEEAYEKELEYFIGTVDGTHVPRYTFEKDKYVLDLIDQIEGIDQHVQTL